MLSKLPDWIVTRWGRIVNQTKEEGNNFPPFKDFVAFVQKEAKIACDPVTSLQSFRTDHGDDSKSAKVTRPTTGRTLMTEASPKEAKPCGTCILCKNNHDLDCCKQFLSKPLDKRKEYARENGLCFGCLGTGHISKKCTQRKQCKTCAKPHPSSLHGDLRKSKPNDKNNNVINNTNLDGVKAPASTNSHVHAAFNSTGTSCIPVYISHCDNPGREKLAYALLDTQSDTTFFLEDTCRSLGISGMYVKLLLSTMYAENRVVDSRKVKGLAVRGFNSSLSIPLPDTFTRSIMPANRAHIRTPEKARQWSYLEPIGELMPLTDCEVGLLIGYNCARALAPREVIAPSDSRPYGQRTDLGWGIVGTVDGASVEDVDPVGTSHRSITCTVPPALSSGDSEKVPDHVVFSFRCSIKEIINPEELALMLEQDFNEPSDTNATYSHEDRQFLNLLKDGIHIDNGHYEMPCRAFLTTRRWH
ncbi:uncharacterized protein LOC132560422 [Ylistrum balloti]|uniref:uncharacterized protein LOC132560422 n=1 Tax=Ylistrum balloti TaxID=509963 RepID=UPI002905CFDA|nr:uncharacterized protein LOC132560422 [Ylistrum balloti]